jgi:hypothetical protein
MPRPLGLAIRLLLAALLLLLPVAPASAGAFGAWAAVVVAGDYRAHSGTPAEFFDNARRDIAKSLVDMGFDPANIRQFSVRPGRYTDPVPLATDYKVLSDTLDTLTKTARGGCFLYFTSHGAPQGIVFGDYGLTPEVMAQLVDDYCSDRPTIVVVSACFSGVFIPALANENRMIITAARPDRTSFGCSEDFKYTFFDQCVLESIPQSQTFPDLAMKAQACVAAREEKEGMSPPSEPQVFIGDRIAPLLDYYTLSRN